MTPRASSRATRRRRADSGLGSPSGVVAIVGRPNVGKSTLFNRLTGERRAIVDEFAGLTRDRLYGITEWAGRRFTVVDTAGLDPHLVRDDVKLAELTSRTQEQARIAIEDADVCVMMVDVRAGITALDHEVAAILRRGGAPVILAGNKAESGTDAHWVHELWQLGLGEPVPISALQGVDTGDLLDRIVDALPPATSDGDDEEDTPTDTLRVAIIGRPNVGKSSLLNALVGHERALVSPIPGTTRDTVDTIIEHNGKQVRLVDTAGIRRRGVVDTNIEHYSLLRSLRAMERSDVAILVCDVSEGTVAQDRHVAGYAAEAGKALVVAANKWDLLPSEIRADPDTIKAIGSAFDFVPGVPVLTVSATEGRNIRRVLDSAVMVAEQRAIRVGTGALNALLRTAMEERPPRFHKQRRLKLMYAAQSRTPSPMFVLFVNDPELMHFSYQRYLENRIRSVFGFNGAPIRMVIRRRDESPGRR